MNCLLAIDTATGYATVAVVVYEGPADPSATTVGAGLAPPGRRQPEVFSRSWLSQHNHGVELMPAIDETLGAAGLGISDVTDIAVVIGPGSFSALRVGLATAQGMARAAGLHLTPIPTFEVEIEPWASRDGPICAAIDAGSSGLAWGLYTADGNGRHLDSIGVDAPGACVGACPDTTVFCGESAQKFTGLVPRSRILSGEAPTRAADALVRVALRRLADGKDRDPSQVEITYARAPTITQPRERLPGGSRTQRARR